MRAALVTLSSALAALLLTAAPARAQEDAPLPEPERLVLTAPTLGASATGAHPGTIFSDLEAAPHTGQRRVPPRRVPPRRTAPRNRRMPPRRGGGGGFRCNRPFRSRPVTVPINVGVAPAAMFWTGPIQDDQLVHYGLRIDVFAAMDRRWLQENCDVVGRYVPASYRGFVARSEEIRYLPSPGFLIPRTLFISPKIKNTGMYGATFNLIGGALGLGWLRVGGHLIGTYAYIHSDTLGTTHFLRPGLELRADLELPLSDVFRVSLGWASQLYIPQQVGGLPWEVLPLNNSAWHVGQAYLMLHFRIPYTRRM